MPINLLAVLIAAVAAFVLGAIWYSPALFGKSWRKHAGMTPKHLKAMKKHAPAAYIFGFILTLVMAYVLAILFDFAGIVNMRQALVLPSWIWLGFIATTTFSHHMWEGKHSYLWIINNAYWLLSLLIMGAILISL